DEEDQIVTRPKAFRGSAEKAGGNSSPHRRVAQSFDKQPQSQRQQSGRPRLGALADCQEQVHLSGAKRQQQGKQDQRARRPAETAEGEQQQGQFQERSAERRRDRRTP